MIIGKETARLIKVHGLAFALMLGGLYFLNEKLASAEDRLLALEGRLFDCYDDRILERPRQNEAPLQSTYDRRSREAVLPDEIKAP